MWTIAPFAHFACRYCHAYVHCLHERLVCATMSFRPLAPRTRHQRLCPHALRDVRRSATELNASCDEPSSKHVYMRACNPSRAEPEEVMESLR